MKTNVLTMCQDLGEASCLDRKDCYFDSVIQSCNSCGDICDILRYPKQTECSENCQSYLTTGGLPTPTVVTQMETNNSQNYRLLFIIIGVALSFILIIMVITLGVVCIKKRGQRWKNPKKLEEQTRKLSGENEYSPLPGSRGDSSGSTAKVRDKESIKDRSDGNIDDIERNPHKSIAVTESEEGTLIEIQSAWMQTEEPAFDIDIVYACDQERAVQEKYEDGRPLTPEMVRKNRIPAQFRNQSNVSVPRLLSHDPSETPVMHVIPRHSSGTKLPQQESGTGYPLIPYVYPNSAPVTVTDHKSLASSVESDTHAKSHQKCEAGGSYKEIDSSPLKSNDETSALLSNLGISIRSSDEDQSDETRVKSVVPAQELQ